MVPSATLKLELTEKMDKALQDKVKNKMPRKGKSVQTRNEQQYPTGVKYHMFKEVMEDMEGARKNNWQSIFKLMGLQAGETQNIIQELLDSYNSNGEKFEKIFNKFQRGERIEAGDLQDNRSNGSSAININLSSALSNMHHSKSGILAMNKSRFSNLRQNQSRSFLTKTGMLRHHNSSVKSIEDPRILGRMNADKEAKNLADVENMKISNAQDLMNFILKQKKKREMK